MKTFKELRIPPATIEESPLVSNDEAILDSIFKKLKQKIESTKNERDQLGMVQQLARMAGYGVTKKAQSKGRSFRWDLKR